MSDNQISLQKVVALFKKVGLDEKVFLVEGNSVPSGSAALSALRQRGSLILKDGAQVNYAPDFSKGIYKAVYTYAPATSSDCETPEEESLVSPTGILEATENNELNIYQSPAGTELLSVLNQMETMLVSGVDTEDWDEDDEEDYQRTLRRGRTPSVHDIKRRAASHVEVPPAAFFQFVNSKMTELDNTNLAGRMASLCEMIRGTKNLGQQALYEQLAVKLARLVREQEAISIGCDRFIREEIISKFIKLVPDRPIKFTEFGDFPRVVPQENADRIKYIQETKVFDGMKILYIDYTGEVFQTNKEKIRIKDPIVFGYLMDDPSQLFHITDWVDEYCDLTLEKILQVFQEKQPETTVVEELDKTLDMTFINNIIQDVEKRHLRLKMTNSRNYRTLMREEEETEDIEPENERRNLEEAAKQEGEPLSFIGRTRMFFRNLIAKR